MIVLLPHVGAAQKVLVLQVYEVLRAPNGCDVRLRKHAWTSERTHQEHHQRQEADIARASTAALCENPTIEGDAKAPKAHLLYAHVDDLRG